MARFPREAIHKANLDLVMAACLDPRAVIDPNGAFPIEDGILTYQHNPNTPLDSKPEPMTVGVPPEAEAQYRDAIAAAFTNAQATRAPLCRARHHKYGHCDRPHHIPGGDHRGSDVPFGAGTYWPRIYPERLWKIRSQTAVTTSPATGQLSTINVWSITPPGGQFPTAHALTLAGAIAFVTDKTNP